MLLHGKLANFHLETYYLDWEEAHMFTTFSRKRKPVAQQKPAYKRSMKPKRRQRFQIMRIKLRVSRGFHAMKRRNNFAPRTSNTAAILQLRQRIWPLRGIAARMQSGGT